VNIIQNLQLYTAMLSTIMAIVLEKHSMGLHELPLECRFQSTSTIATVI